MLKNYLKVAIRNLWRNKTFSFLNIIGLALGMACSLLIILWVNDERSVDAFHANGARLYTVYERQYYDNKIESGTFTPGLLSEEMKRNLPEVEYAVNADYDNLFTFQVGEKIIKESGMFSGEDFFKMFSYPLLQGKPQSALKSTVDVAISQKMANDFFGSPENAIGKTIRYENKKDFTVAAVFENVPENVSQKFDFVINWQTYLDENFWAKDWGNNGPRTFFMLRADAKPALFEKKLTHFLDKYNKDQSASFRIEMGMQRFGDTYLHSNFKNGKIEGGRIEYVRLFSIVAVFILLIACINFMNLTTARSVKRAKEIGIRKVVGAVRMVLMRQFIGEALLLAFIAVVQALAMVALILPFFNNLTAKQIAFPFTHASFWLYLTGLTILTGFISGSYPALFLSSFNPIRVLKGAMKFSAGATFFRKGLVVFQFVLSIVLIIATIIVSKQVNFIQTVNLGYDRSNLIYIPLEGDLTGNYSVFKDEAVKLQGILNVTRISNSPTNIENNTGGVQWDGKDPNTVPMFTQASVGYDFVKTMKLQVVQGRDFSKEFATDSVGYMLNEAAVKKIGYKDPIGRPLTFWGKKGTIVGVLKDFHYTSMHKAIDPIIIRLREKEQYGSALVKTEPGKTKEALAGLETLCKKLNPKFPFTYNFSDQEYQKLYKSEQMVGKLSNYFAFLAIFICCLGLLGLAMFTAEQRTKEIGIRKVLGASVGSLFGLLSKEFLVLVVVALLIATPLAWFAMHAWLQDFVYRTSIDWWIFVLAGLLAILIALITVSSQAIKAATANPVKSMRTE